ncbi:MAG: translocation/assembly module TamB domain-containing protein [Gammaproteobacteria bacterium]|nr:hypothetical protein [Rhodocyclaceae bacterium]MBU3910339.1 translocation/assembly module TamB domain-containing protein [Gammaproteobacteria bacterium]MBU3990269.1 translocation/assembly module TamB domain-containing protein [Gammaproteobacteria bacterium]MBU4004166.1 translocation/assembly module TamB domain-containing protein [Gammaproteobacteria bacterium]MBU4020413.1 translocation/assembly module TamB domain-containing protein [Gammaproteobacteria bacterium]
MSSALPKKIAVWAMRVLLALLAFAGLLAWLLGTEAALQMGARQAERLSDGRLTLQAVSGSLYGPLRIEALSVQSEEQRFEVKKIALDWAPLQLIRQHIQFERLALEELRITELKPSAEPAQLPEILQLPLRFSAPAVTVERVVIVSAGKEHVLRGIDLAVDKSADSYTLSLRSIASAWGQGSAELVLGDAQPFMVKGQASLQQDAGVPYRATAEATGDLRQLLLKATANALGGQVALDATLTPFEAFPLARAHIKANGINPALLRQDLPKAVIGADISVERQGAAGLAGMLRLWNELPGPLDQARLPLRELSTRFAGTLDQLELSALDLDMAAAGRFSGSGQLKDQQLQLVLNTVRFNPQHIHGKLHPLQLAGDMRLSAQPELQQLVADLRYQGFRLHLDALHRDETIELRAATVESAAGKLALQGTLALPGPQPFKLAGTLQNFNPADFGDYPVARLNATFSGSGSLAAGPQAALEFAIADSQLRHQPLSGQGKLNVSPQRIWNSQLLLRLADNRLEAQGALGGPDDRLDFKLAAENLSALDPQLGGKGHATGTLAGRFAALSGNIDAQLDNLSWRKQYRVASLRAKGRLEQGVAGQLELDASVRGLVTPQLRLERASVQAQGTRSQHTLQFLAKNAAVDIDSRFQGGWSDASGWAGQVTELANRGRHAFVLKAPAKLAVEVARQRLLLGNARFDLAGAKLVFHELAYDAGQIASRGEFSGLPLAYLQGPDAADADFTTDLVLGGDWQLAARNSVNGHLALWRERGDIALPTESPATLGLSQFSVNLDAVSNRLQGRLEASGIHLGSLRANAESLLSLRDGVWGIAGDAPLQGSADLSVASLAWLQPLFGGAANFNGAVKAHLQATGSFGQPELAGTLSGERFTLALPEHGLSFRDGRLEAELAGQEVKLTRLELRGGDGKLSGQGRLALAAGAPSMQLALQADKLEVFARPDRHLVLSGTSDVSFAGKALQIAAKLKADRGLIELPKADAPTLGADVVVLGRTTGVKQERSSYSVDYALDLDLGDHFYIKGKGLDAQLGGALKLAGTADGLPTSRGSIRVVKGAYAAYGQRLAIERGIFNFQGPVDNPGLDIIALRKNQPVEAGVAVSGTAQSPRVKLVSNPTVPDNQKLSWLVLGHGGDDTSKQEFNALQAAAGALLGAGESVTLQQKIAYAAGLEEISLKGGGELEGTVLALGKRLSSRAYLSFEQGLAGAGTLVKINYALTKRLSVQTQAGAAPAADLFYTISFD